MANNITDIRGTPDDDTRTSIDGLCEPIMWGHEGPSATSTRIGSDRIYAFFLRPGYQSDRIGSDICVFLQLGYHSDRIGSDICIFLDLSIDVTSRIGEVLLFQVGQGFTRV